jgi:ABC-type transporter Mla maintaining outer membrane lipid asymmetry permease subunit MlaE
MNNNDDYYPLKVFFDVIYIFGYVFIWGAFLLIVTIAVETNGFPNGLMEGLIFGSLITVLGCFKNYRSHRDAVEAGRKLWSYFQGKTDLF